MKTVHYDVAAEKKGHICPPSSATHPSDRWESLFVYSFICKFTNLRGNVEGLLSPMDFEEALLSKEPNTIMTEILARFVRNLRPQTRNVSTDQISSTVAGVLSDFIKSSERTVFWDDNLRVNVDPFSGLEGGFFTADWDLKLKILRQLVELQLCHAPEVKGLIDHAWGVVHNKHKKKETPAVPPDASDPYSQEKLQLIPIGQDNARKRYWVADDSPRLYLSTNPWKITATFQAIASTREDYMNIIERLKLEGPTEPKEGEKRTKSEQGHLTLVKNLENRVEAIDAELARIAKARRKVEQKYLFNAQAEIRQTRLRRATRRPDYAYLDGADSEEDVDEYKYQEEQDDEEYQENLGNERFSKSRSVSPSATSSRRASVPNDRRRSSRAAAIHANEKRVNVTDEEITWNQWRGERRSSRLGAPPETQFAEEALSKRARTEDSSISAMSTHSVEPQNEPSSSGLKIKIQGAASLKPTEVALEQVAGKKKSKFWYYAVEPVPGQSTSFPPQPQPKDAGPSDMNGYRNGNGAMESRHYQSSRNGENGNGHERVLEGSLSPASSWEDA